MYEQANILILTYDCDSKKSLEELGGILSDFHEYNKQGSFILLVGFVSKALYLRKKTRKILKPEIKHFMAEEGIASYAEVRLDTKKNLDLVNKHLEHIYHAYLEQLFPRPGNQIILFKPLFETIILPAKKSAPVFANNKREEAGCTCFGLGNAKNNMVPG